MKTAVVIGLNAVIMAVTDEQPRVLTVKRAEQELVSDLLEDVHASEVTASRDALPFALLDPLGDRTIEQGLRARVREQTGLELGYVEQLYTFGDRNRLGLREESGPRVISIAYLALVHEEPTRREDAVWRNCYRYFPWEDWRQGRPEVLERHVDPALARWIAAAPDCAGREARKERAAITFGYGSQAWDGERVLERYELLYELGLVQERHRDDQHSDVHLHAPALFSHDSTEVQVKEAFGEAMALDHRRILSTALGRIRGKIRYRPVVFELVSEVFTLLQLQRVVEALAGVPLHKQNFRRLVEKGGLVEGTGVLDTQTGGRPAELFRFRREVLRERPSPGVGLPGASVRSTAEGRGECAPRR